MEPQSTQRRQAETVALSWRIQGRTGDEMVVRFYGEIDEHADFSELRRRLRGAVRFDLSEVRRLNSSGVREWMNFVRDLPGVTELTFSHCSPAIVTQLNMICDFGGRAKVRSFLAPYVCEGCSLEEEKLLDVQLDFPAAGPRRLPEFTCDRCGARMEFDDLPERYLAFLEDAGDQAGP